MADGPTNPPPSKRPSRSSRTRAFPIAGLVVGAPLVAILGGVAGRLIVNATSGDGETSSSTSNAAVCRATHVADIALPSVVTDLANAGQQGGTGSGVIIRSGGYILTNDHVISVAANGGAVSLLYSDGETADATILGRDPFTDLAVLKSAGHPAEPFADHHRLFALRAGRPAGRGARIAARAH